MEPKVMISRYLDDLLTDAELQDFSVWLKADRLHVKQFVMSSMDANQIAEVLSEHRVKEIMETSGVLSEDSIRDAGFGGVEFDQLVACEDQLGWQACVDLTEDMKERHLVKQPGHHRRDKLFAKDDVDEHRAFVIPRMGFIAALIGFVAVTLIVVMNHRELERTIDQMGVDVPVVVEVIEADVDVEMSGVGVELAVVRRVHDVVWADGDGVGFSAGDVVSTKYYELKSGLVELEMIDTGAVVLVHGPSKFKLLNKNAIKLMSGDLTALVRSELAKGFYVDTPQGRIVDLGTEFGVQVNPLGGTQAMVFEGEVVLKTKYAIEKGGAGVNLYKGYHSRMRRDGYVDPVAKETTRFESVHFTRLEKMDRIFRAKNGSAYDQWLLDCEEISKRHGLVYYYNGALQESRQGEVFNQAVGAGKDFHEVVGKIVGAKWRAGRWGDSTALAMKDASEYVELDLPGRFNDLTLMSWIKLDPSGANKMRAILNSEGWSRVGNLHWQLNETMGVDIGLQTGRDKANGERAADRTIVSRSTKQMLGYGDWHHLVAVFDRSTNKIRYYVDGVLHDLRDNAFEGDIVFGKTRMGSWLTQVLVKGRVRNADTRTLGGWMDSLMIFDQALGGEEVADIYNKTRARKE